MRKKNKKNSLSRFKGVVIKSLSKGVFVLAENKEFFISSKNSLFALEGDVVLVSKSLKRKNLEITKVVKRCRDEFVGVLDFSSCKMHEDTLLNDFTPLSVFELGGLDDVNFFLLDIL